MEAVSHDPRKKGILRKEGSSAPAYSHAGYDEYLDTIPTEVLQGLLRFMSQVPQARNWEKHVPLRYIIDLYRIPGNIANDMNGRYHTLCISKTVDCVHERARYKWKVPNEGILWTDSINDAYEFILTVGGASLRTIIIGDEMFDEGRNGPRSDMAKYFLAVSPNVRSLSVVEDNGMWASAFAMQLEKLEVVTWNPGRAIPSSCPSLRELNLYFDGPCTEGLPDPEKFLFEIDIDWRGVGSKLETLKLSNFRFTKRGLRTIWEYCKNLTHIDIYSISFDNQKIAGFLGSYGMQLDSVYVRNMTENELNYVAGKCPRARFHADITERDCKLLPTLRILGSRLEGIHFDYKSSVIDPVEWAAAWNLCTNLQVLHVSSVKEEEMRAIMDTPKHNLKEIRIFSDYYEEDVYCKPETIMNIIAQGSQNIEVLQLPWFFSYFGAVRNFMNNSKSTLREVFIINSKDDPPKLLQIHYLIKEFLQSTALESITVEENILESTLNCLKRRGIHFRGNFSL